MGVFDFFKGPDGKDTITGGRCDRCIYCREMPILWEAACGMLLFVNYHSAKMVVCGR